jgi:hypothetical protein
MREFAVNNDGVKIKPLQLILLIALLQIVIASYGSDDFYV